MNVVSVLNKKGGVGKTTTSINLSVSLQQFGYRVLLVDSDPQGSARQWAAQNPENTITVVGIEQPTLERDLKSIGSDYDFVIVDGAPRLNEMAISAIKASDLVIVPVQPSPLDLWACSDLVEMILSRQSLLEKPLSRFLVSRAKKGTKFLSEIEGDFEALGMSQMNTVIHEREIYKQAPAQGLTPLEVDMKSDAAAESVKLAKEIAEMLGGNDVDIKQSA